MDRREIEYVIVIAQEKTLSKAADRLFVSQPALSRFLLKLEDELGLPLFERRKRQLIPTYAGELYLATARSILQLQQKLEKELADLKRQNAITEMAKTARKMLADEEINIPDELLGHLVSENAEDTKTAVEAFAKMYKAAVQAAVKDALKGNPPKAGSGGKGNMTKDQILAITNPAERQRLIAENMELFQ